MKIGIPGLVTSAVLAASAGLTGCGDPAASGTGAEAAPAVFAPERRDGLWKQRMLLVDGGSIENILICIDRPTDRAMSWWGSGEACGESAIDRQPDGSWTFRSVCLVEGGGKITTSGRVVGDLEKAYQLSATATMSGHPDVERNGTQDVTIDASWEGDCPADVKPGYMKLPSGTVVQVVKPSA